MSIGRLIIKSKTAAKEIEAIIDRLNDTGPVNQQDLEKLAYIKKYHRKIFQIYESKILYLMGLFYKPLNPNSIIEMVYSNYAQIIEQELQNRFTPIQAHAIKNINDNQKQYFSFSAPTSCGKSYMFMDLIKKRKNDIVIIVPSRALIAEYMTKVLEIVKHDKSILLLQFVENINKKHTSRRIFILTPERARDLFRFKSVLNIDLFLFDEAQISEEKIRGLTFDSIIRKINREFPRATKVFAHPFIKNPEAQLQKHHIPENTYSSMNYHQNAVGKIYLTPENSYIFSYRPTFKPDKTYYTRNIIQSILKKDKTTILIYSSKRKIYDKKHLQDFKDYISLCKPIENVEALELIKELQEYIGASKKETHESLLIEMMKLGIVIHHGSIPLKARFLIEKFVNRGFAKICFATSTLTQGINMPFDVVWIDNFRFEGNDNQKALTLKNLIGRAGRSNADKNEFDYGYVVIPKRNFNLFIDRLKIEPEISNLSEIDREVTDDIDEDYIDLIEATRDNTFDDNLQITNKQKERIKAGNISDDIKYVLDNLFVENKIIDSDGYKELSTENRNAVKECFKNIFLKHLRRTELSSAEQSILSVALRILLWKIEGRSFSQIVALRLAYVTQVSKQRLLKKELVDGKITEKEYKKQLGQIRLVYSQKASQLPNKNAMLNSLFSQNSTLKDFDYDKLVYDTYDYLDDVISQSMTNPLSAAFQLYYEETGNSTAKSMVNYLKYGTDVEKEIMLLKYGFEFEDMDWIKEFVVNINEDEIEFSTDVENLDVRNKKIIDRYYCPSIS